MSNRAHVQASADQTLVFLCNLCTAAVASLSLASGTWCSESRHTDPLCVRVSMCKQTNFHIHQCLQIAQQ